MRLPFLQVPQLDLSRGRTLARILRIPEAHGIGLTVALDAWAVDEAPEGDVSGLIRDQNPAEAVALAVGWDGPPEQLLAALVRVKLVEETPGGPCVVSVRRYESALSGPTRRSEHASRAATERWHRKKDALGMGRALPDDAYTQTQTQTQTEDLAGAVAPAPRNELRLEAQQAPRKRAQRPDKATDARHAPLVKALVGLGFPFDGGKDAKHVEQLLVLADQQAPTTGPAAPGEVLRRARIAWDQFGAFQFHSARTLSGLRAKWGEFAEARQQLQGRGPAPPSDFEKPREYVEPAWLDPNFGKE